MALWISIAIVTLVATALVVWPLVSTRRPRADAHHDDERRLAVFRDRKRELDRERDAGRITDAEAEQAHADLVLQLAEDLPEVAAAAAAPASSGAARVAGTAPGTTAGSVAARSSPATWATAVFVAVLVPLIAFGVYRQVGAPQLASGDVTAGGASIDAAQIEAMIERIEQRTRENPDDVEAWAMLAEARKMQGRHDEAVAAFEQATERLPNDARLLTDYAESAALRAGGDFTGQPIELLERALAIDPGEPKAVALMGAAQYRAGNLPRARTYLQQLETFLEPGSEEATQIAAILQSIEGEISGQPPGTGTSAPHPLPPSAQAGAQSRQAAEAETGAQSPQMGPASPGTGAPAALAGSVSVDPSLAERAAQGGTLFVIARASGGPPIPIAVLRVPAPDFPTSFTLDDANAMDPSRRLSGVASLDLEARLSRSGEAMRQPGDLYGRIENVQPGSADLRIVLDQVVSR